MCTNYRALNRVTIKSRYPILRADELIDQLRGARFFSKIDLKGGYHRFAWTKLTATRWHFGPITDLTMNEIFRPLMDKCAIVYLDDILVYNTTREQHLKDLETVFSLLQQNRLITKGLSASF
ncbi:hypothetical protein CLOP_g14308 [Closterium sp. NIES-67]|nr:hypothetical protein CLOP_g14308 [Closterium sp. NIES-67]